MRRTRLESTKPKSTKPKSTKLKSTKLKSTKPKPLVRVPRAQSIVFAPDERRFSTVIGKRGQIWSLDANAEDVAAQITELEMLPHSREIIFAPTGPLVASVTTKGVVGIYHSEDGGGPLRKMKMEQETGSPVFINDDLLLVADRNGNLVTWDVKTGAEVAHLRFPGQTVTPFGVLERGDGRGYAQIRTVGDYTPYHWVAFDPQHTRELDARISFVDSSDRCLRALVPNPSGACLVVRARDFIELVELPSKKVIVHLDVDKMYLGDVRFSPDGQYAMFTNTERCWILEGATFKPCWIYDGALIPAFSPGQRLFALKNEIWEAEDFAPLMDGLVACSSTTSSRSTP
ncbi:MAG: WD40 repeat domain-containing protein [Deltaproteobacteria bacterium]|nr:WD40 repeat domain-containing protein [Deltaproteobacteria bacterium]